MRSSDFSVILPVGKTYLRPYQKIADSRSRFRKISVFSHWPHWTVAQRDYELYPHISIMKPSPEKTRKIYVDTNVYLDLFLNRTRGYRDLGEEANQLFRRAKGCEFAILVSDVVLGEIDGAFPHLVPDFVALKRFLDWKALPVPVSEDDRRYARSLTTHFEDALHIAVAVRSGADCIVTRNVKHFTVSPLPVVSPDAV
jgi:predicted nucleic acid-binding protein